jgi:hypothetical protein
MLLIPIRPTQKAPRVRNEMPVLLKYPWEDWFELGVRLKAWGVDVKPPAETNDGERIPARLCHKIADAIEAHLSELAATGHQGLADGRWIQAVVSLRLCDF